MFNIREIFDSFLLFCNRKNRVRNAVWEFEDFWASWLSPNVVGNIQFSLCQHKLIMKLFPNSSHSLLYVFEEPFNRDMLIEFINRLVEKGYKVTPADARNGKVRHFEVIPPPNYKRFAE